MSWVTSIWSVVASACLTLAAMHLLVWCRKRTEWANLLFALTAVATAALACCEFWMMRAETPGQFGTALRWLHVPAWALLVSLVGFVRLYLRAGRSWLAWSFFGLRTFSLLLDFLTGQNLNYLEVTRLRHIPFFGEFVSVAEGVSNPWMLVGQLSLLLLVIFVADATVTVWRRGDRRQALVVGGSIVFFVLAATGQAVLVLWQIVPAPITASIFYLGIVAAMGYELSRETLQAAQLSADLRESEERMTLAAEAAGFGVWMWSIPRQQVWGSERWLRLFGFAPDATVSFEMVMQRIHPDDCGRVEREVQCAVEDRADYAGEYRVILPDGTQRWIAARGRAYLNASGTPARMLGTAIDITERKRTEEALQNSEEKFRQFFNNIPDYCYIISTEGNILHINKAALNTLGYKREELVGKPLAGIYAPESLARMEGLFNQWKETGQIRNEEMVIVTRKGERRVVILNVGVVKDKDGTIRHSTSVQTDITESERTEAALKESEQRFRQVAETVADFIWEVDTQGLYTYASPSVEKIMGYTPEELVGKKHFYDLFDPSVREELKAAAFQVFAERQTFRDFPNPNVSQSGKIVHLETSGAPVLDPAGNLTGYRGADTDVTGRKRVEEALQESEARFRTVANTAPVLIWMAGTDKLCNFFNKSWLDFTGRALEQELGNGWAEGVHPDDLAGCWKIYVESFDARRPFTMEYRLRRHDGEYRWISDHGVPRYDSERDFLGYIGSCVDLTERKRAEEEMRQSEERLRLVLEANSEGVWDWNIPSGKAFFSRRYSAMLGYEPEEFVTDYDAWKALVHPDDFERVHAEHVAHIDHGKEFCVEFRMRKKSGDWCWIRARGTVVERDTEGRAIRMVGTHQDITGRKQAEAELLRERAELAHVARVSTMGELAASVAHELNQPLGAILANAEAAELFLQQDPPALDELRGILTDIRKDDERAGEVIRRMRALLRKHELERQPLEINSLVEDVLQFVSGDAALRGISLTADLGPVLPKVAGDRVHLQQVLLNLILNGMDAMAGQPRERRQISVRTRLGADGRVELAVIDSGHGIEPDKLARLFEPFYTTKPNGMGMELSIARTIIEAHHGRIWAENNASGGAVFRIALPTLEERVVSEQSSAISNR